MNIFGNIESSHTQIWLVYSLIYYCIFYFKVFNLFNVVPEVLLMILLFGNLLFYFLLFVGSFLPLYILVIAFHGSYWVQIYFSEYLSNFLTSFHLFLSCLFLIISVDNSVFILSPLKQYHQIYTISTQDCELPKVRMATDCSWICTPPLPTSPSLCLKPGLFISVLVGTQVKSFFEGPWCQLAG